MPSHTILSAQSENNELVSTKRIKAIVCVLSDRVSIPGHPETDQFRVGYALPRADTPAAFPDDLQRSLAERSCLSNGTTCKSNQHSCLSFRKSLL